MQIPMYISISIYIYVYYIYVHRNNNMKQRDHTFSMEFVWRESTSSFFFEHLPQVQGPALVFHSFPGLQTALHSQSAPDMAWSSIPHLGKL